ncbi:uncharacterized protein LOC135952310 [Calliphora vicina]|uniref:uncharacterized protein LOC135952310 n=1 Tax=Calliphora vicina TaxID=7373 RepID=UPI00325C0282
MNESELCIKIQPKQNFHFRYESDIKKQGNTHGVLQDQQKDKYPTIELSLPANKRNSEFFVLCSLHRFTDTVPKTLSPHLLMRKGVTELNYEFIFEKMKTVEDNQMKRVWELRDCVIVRIKSEEKTKETKKTKKTKEYKEYNNSFTNKKAAYERLQLPSLAFEELLGELNLNDPSEVKDSGILNVCLGFTIFEKKAKAKYDLYTKTIYSCNIYHGDDLSIHKLCNTRGSVLGGTEITILIRLESNLPLNVFIKKIDERTRQTVWSTTVRSLQLFGNAAVTFTMPPYQGPPSTDEEIEVYMCVMVKNTTYKSDKVKFIYINERPRKRSRVTEQHDYTSEQIANVSRQSSDVRCVSYDHATLPEFSFNAEKNIDIQFKIDKFFKTAKNPNHIVSCEHLYSIFYDALESEEAFKHLYKMAKDSSNNKLVADFRNENGENLLHMACQMNKFKRIRPLIGLGCHINEQDYIGRTPLHVALAKQHIDCVAEILFIFNNISKYPKEVETDLMKMIRAYNHDGHTVLHAAMLGQYKELCEAILMFMHKHDMNVLDVEVLGSGDSIAHLAVKHNLMTIRPLIEKYVSNYKMVKNYAGIMVQELEDKMLEKLKI